jgi:hypothetical protein
MTRTKSDTNYEGSKTFKSGEQTLVVEVDWEEQPPYFTGYYYRVGHIEQAVWEAAQVCTCSNPWEDVTEMFPESEHISIEPLT